jgi:hypothetical protein
VDQSAIAPNAVGPSELADGAVDTAALQDGAVTAPKLAAGATVGNLGFTPVQQGNFAGLLTNTVHIGWTGGNKLAFAIDATLEGNILAETTAAEPDSAGYRGSPFNPQPNDYTLALTDAARTIYHNHAVGHAYTIPPNSAVALPAGGTQIGILSAQGVVTITPGVGVTLIWAGSGATGARTLAAKGYATILKAETDVWYIMGTGLS